MSLPAPPAQKNYEISKERATKALSSISPGEIAHKTGAHIVENRLEFSFFRWNVGYDFATHTLILPPELRGKSTEGLILHYLAYARGARPAGEWINFYQIKDAALYMPVFTKRTIGIINQCVRSLADFTRKCPALGGNPVEFSSSAVAYRFEAFPYVPLLLVYYEGDDEIGSEIKFMFDASVVSNLHAEDAVVAAQFLSLQFFKV